MVQLEFGHAPGLGVGRAGVVLAVLLAVVVVLDTSLHIQREIDFIEDMYTICKVLRKI
jgi:hypothetical protein